jgi:hypothetical protein
MHARDARIHQNHMRRSPCANTTARMLHVREENRIPFNEKDVRT